MQTGESRQAYRSYPAAYSEPDVGMHASSLNFLILIFILDVLSRRVCRQLTIFLIFSVIISHKTARKKLLWKDWIKYCLNLVLHLGEN